MRLFSTLLLFVLSAACLAANQEPPLASEDREPVRGERPLNDWIELSKSKDRAARGSAVQRLREVGPAAIPALTGLLRDEDAPIRAGCANALGSFGLEARSAVPVLAELLRDQDGMVRRCAVSALRQMGLAPKSAIPALIESLQDDYPGVRVEAITALGQMGPNAEAAIPILLGFLTHKDDSVRMASFSALANIGPPAIPALVDVLRGKEPMSHGGASVALQQMGPRAKPAIPTLIELLRDERVEVRRETVQILGKIGPEAKAAVPALIELLQTRPPEMRNDVRPAVAVALGRIDSGTEPAVRSLAESLQDRNLTLQRCAAEALGHIGPPAAPAIPSLLVLLRDSSVGGAAVGTLARIGSATVPSLTPLLQDKDRKVRRNAAQALAEIGSEARAATPLLVGLLADKEVRYMALAALRSIGPGAKEAVPALTNLLQDENLNIRMLAAGALSKIGPDAEPALPALSKMLLRDENPGGQEAAARAIGEIGPAAIPTLADLLKEKDDFLRGTAAMACGTMGPRAKSMVPVLSGMLRDKTPSVRARAAIALGRMGGEAKTAVPLLIDLLQDREQDFSVIEPSGPVCRSAAQALGEIGSEARAAVPGIIGLLHDHDDGIRWTALKALGQIGPEARIGVPAIVKSLRDKNVRVVAAETLGKIGPEARSAIPKLTESLLDQDHRMRQASAEALGMIGPEAKSAMPALSDALQDIDEKVRSAAAAALKNIGNESREPLPMAFRVFEDSTGRFKVEAALVDVQDGMVRLRRKDDRTVTVPQARLSQKDQAYVRQMAASRPANEHAPAKGLAQEKAAPKSPVPQAKSWVEEARSRLADDDAPRKSPQQVGGQPIELRFPIDTAKSQETRGYALMLGEATSIPFVPGESFDGNDDFSQIMWVEEKMIGQRLFHNGDRGRLYQAIVEGDRYCVHSADGRTFAYVAAKQDSDCCVVVNEKEGPPYAGIIASTLALSPDGAHVAYAAHKKDSRFMMVVDGKESGDYHQVAAVRWSPDSKRLAYIAGEQQAINAGTGMDVFVDGRRYRAAFRSVTQRSHRDRPDSNSPIVFSGDSKRWAVRGQVFGPDTMEDGGIGGFAVMVDGKMHPTYPDVVVDTLAFTPDSSQVIYAAGGLATGDYFLVREGKRGKPWNYIGQGSIQFGNNGKSIGMIAYTGKREGRFAADNPVDGRPHWSPGTPSLVVNDAVIATAVGSFALSPTSDRRIWIPLRMRNDFKGPRNATITDGAKLAIDVPEGRWIQHLQFSADGQHWACLITEARGERAMQLIFDGIVFAAPPSICILHVAFKADDSLHAAVLLEDRTGLTNGRVFCRMTIKPVKLAKFTSPCGCTSAVPGDNQGGDAMAKDDETFEQWLRNAKIQPDRLRDQQQAVLRAAFQFLQHGSEDYSSSRIAGHFLLLCGVGLKVAQIARLVGISPRSAARHQKLSAKQVSQQIQHHCTGRPYGKLLPRHAGSIAAFLFGHPKATRDEVLDFIARTWEFRVSKVALWAFLKKYGLDRASLEESRQAVSRDEELATVKLLDSPGC